MVVFSRIKKPVVAGKTFITKQSTRTKLIAAGVFVALLVPVVTFALKNEPKPPTTEAQPQTVQTPEEPHVAPATTETPQPTPEAPGASQQPAAQQTAQTPTPTTKKSAPKYDNSTALPPAQVVTPSSFGIRLSPWSVTNYNAYSFSVPYAFYRIGSHTAPITATSGQLIPAAQGAGCYPSPRQDNYGELSVWLSGSAPAGQYTCKMTATDGTETRTAQFSFVFTGSSIQIL